MPASKRISSRHDHKITLPLYALFAGLELSAQAVDLLSGVVLRRVFVDTFTSQVMAFAPPEPPNLWHPGPWAPVTGELAFQNRVELEINDLARFGNLKAETVAWLVAFVLRTRFSAPIRLALISDRPVSEIVADTTKARAFPFEGAPHQIGSFSEASTTLDGEPIEWLRHMLPVATVLYEDEKFIRAASIFDSAQWSATKEIGAVLVWTALEILFGISAQREKTKTICRATANYIGRDSSDIDRAYQIVRDLYKKRGSAIHAGRALADQDIAQSFQIGHAVFQRVLIDGAVPGEFNA